VSVPAPIPPSTTLIPPAGELRGRLALALREVDFLRRLIRVAEYAGRYGQLTDTTPPVTDQQEVARA
jgi:hypothetical protein